MDSHFEGRPWSVTYARKALPVLVSLTERRQRTTYKELAGRLGNEKNANPLKSALGTLGMALISLEKKEGKKFGKIPPIQLLVCNGRTGRPGDSGLNFIELTKSQIARMSKQALDTIVDGVHKKIFDFRHWPEVLKLLGLKPLTLSLPSPKSLLPKIEKIEHHPGGEQEDHKRLKLFLARKPKRIGISWKGYGDTEQMVLSGDRPDISFRNEQSWTCVEVKGKQSPEPDLIRGIFQCVKYQAVLEAQLRYEALQGQEQGRKVVPRVLLACGGKLPNELQDLAELLGVQVESNISVPKNFVL